MTFSFIIPVIVVTILNVFLGMLWYSPLLFGPMWIKGHKFDNKRLKPTAGHYIGSILVYFITALILAMLITRFVLLAWDCGALLAFYIWIGFVATTHFKGVIWAHRPFSVYCIDVAYYLVSLVMMGALLGAWL